MKELIIFASYNNCYLEDALKFYVDIKDVNLEEIKLCLEEQFGVFGK